MIEALIRDEKRLVCVITIQEGPDKDSLNVDIFIPSKGQTLSGAMPAGGEPAQLVARAVMTVFPVSALKPEGLPLSPEITEDTIVKTDTEKAIAKFQERVVKLDEGEALAPPRPEPGPESDRSKDERWAALKKKDLELDEREKKLDRDIKNFRNFRKPHVSDPLGDRPKWP